MGGSIIHERIPVKWLTFILAFTEEIAEALVRGDKVSIRGFGTFEPKMFQSHPAVHPGTGERIMVESYKNVVFRPGDELIRMVREEK